MDAAISRGRFDWVAYLKLFRAPLVFTAVADSAAGYLVFCSTPHASVLAALAVCSAGLYFFGMAANDLADLERDRAGAPGRVLPSGRISPRAGRMAAGLALAASAGCAGAFAWPVSGFQVLVPWGLALGGILAYDLHWIKAPPVMGLVRAANLSIGLAAAVPIGFLSDEWARPWHCAVVAGPLFAYVTALTYVSTLEEGQALSRGRLATGAGVMILAALAAASVGLLWRLVLGSSPRDLLAQTRESFSWTAVVVASSLGVWLARRAVRARDRKGVMLLVRDGVAGIILVDASLVLSLTVRPVAWGLGVAALLLPAAGAVALFKKLA